MTLNKTTIVSSCRELAPGDDIKAFYNGSLVHHGKVTETVPDHGLFWIMDMLTGGRRLLDMAELEITRPQALTPTESPGTEPAVA
ncbi:hypothetical protein FCN77_12915 [Arthrobacter sp. 24S4-2]|uniref:hypothetical protein n=1 Tax=Arthrobacter sp. 24S4-2 TaxID=2575374 RepID=UPI0010C779CB|nr:hypothetical protein [Arthrobacter sp. 24S4-2]QCO98424.1 hypothetical protein FCN77_12915 [Arthrobacter sp. 24S4-2]